MKAFLKYTLLPVFTIILIVGFLVFINASFIDTRMTELNILLQKMARNQDKNKSLNILSKYETVLKRLKTGSAESVEDYRNEAKVQAVISGDYFSSVETEEKRWNVIRPFTRTVMNGIRVMVGKEVIHPDQEMIEEYNSLDLAYYLERSRHYKSAIDLYDSLLAKISPNNDLYFYIMLHQAFCYSMTGEFQKTKQVLDDVIKNSEDVSTTMIAWKMLDVIVTILEKTEQTSSSEMPLIEQALTAYKLMDYKRAVTLYGKIINRSGRGSPVVARALFMQGRAYEEMGETEKAEWNYNQVIKLFPASNAYVKKSGRRLYIMGEFYEYNRKISQKAEKILKEFGDDEFFNDLKRYSRIKKKPVSEKVRKQVKKAEGRHDVHAGNQDILDVISEIGQQVEKRKEMEKKEVLRRTGRLKEKIPDPVKLRKSSRTAEQITSIVRANMASLKRVFKQYIRRGVIDGGVVNIYFEILPDGGVRKVKVKNTNIDNEEFTNNIIRRVRTWRFPPDFNTNLVQPVTYPLEFRKTE
ncbi:MAG: AgmX/PglI C-terminal domain-containing protein [Fibrobacterota bacterium]